MSLIFLALLLAALGGAVYGIRSLKTLSARANENWNTLNALYKRRNKVISQMLDVFKYFALSERDTIHAIGQANNQSMSAAAIGDKLKAEKALDERFRTFMLQVSNTPSLKTNRDFQEMRKEFNELEDRISLARRAYIEIAQQFNRQIGAFPLSFLGSLAKLKSFPIN